jgi:hypothetical protein
MDDVTRPTPLEDEATFSEAFLEDEPLEEEPFEEDKLNDNGAP